MSPRNRRPAFTMIELLVTFGILGVLLGLLVPAVQRARESANRTQCLNNLHQIGVALFNHHTVYGRLPLAQDGDAFKGDPEALLSWTTFLLPYMDEGPLYAASLEACRRDRKPYNNPPHIGYATVIRSYVCPSDGRLFTTLETPKSGRAAFTDYIGVAGVVRYGRSQLGVLTGGVGPQLSEIRDGTSQTLMVGERPPPDSRQAGRWYTRACLVNRNDLCRH